MLAQGIRHAMGYAMRSPSPSPVRTLATCAATALILAGCAADYQNYPSLARRPAERITGIAEVVPAATVPARPAPLSPDLTARLVQLSSQAQAAHGEFSSRRARAEQLVAAAGGAPLGSEAWAQASVALADLESARSRAMIALADLDALYAAGTIADGDAGAIAVTRSRVIAWIGEEDQILAQLRGRIAS